MFRKKVALWLFPILIGFGLGVFLFSSNVQAGTSANGKFTISPKVNNTDNLIAATNTEWVFSVTTTADLAAGGPPTDIIRFILPTTTAGIVPFNISSPSSTSLTGISLAYGPGQPGVSSTILSDGRPAFYGFIGSAYASNTVFSISLRGVNNASGTLESLTNLVWEVEAGTSNGGDPAAPLSVVKFTITSTAALASAGGGGGGPSATSSISNVVLTDVDTTGFGLDGRDFMVTWNPGTSTPAGYQYTKIYIVTSTINLTTSNLSTACAGMSCMQFGMFNQYSIATNTLPQFVKTDSAYAPLSTTTQYVAWIYVQATTPFIVSSSPATVVYDNVADVNKPQIDHIGVHTAKEQALAVINSFIVDDQTFADQFNAPAGVEYFKLYYGTDVSVSESFVSAVKVTDAGLFSFSIPTSSVPAAGGTLEYYLAANDVADNSRFFCANPNATSSVSCKSSPFVIHTVSAGSRSISGTITASGSNLASAKVFPGGYASPAVTTDGSGNYTITGLPDNNSFDITANKAGYTKISRMENIGTSDKTAINLTLNQGSIAYFFPSSGGGSNGGAPHVMFSGPPDGMKGFPINQAIRVGFDQPLDSTAINSADTTDAASPIYLTTDDGTTKIAGSVLYCSNNTAPGCSALFSMDNNTILFTPTANLSTSTQYTLVIKEDIKNQSGLSIQGNRTGGGHKITFTTVSNNFSGVSSGQWQTNMNLGGQYLPPFVKSMSPAPGMSVAPNTSILIEFNQALNSETVTASNITLWNGATQISSGVTVSLDSNEKRFATLSHSALSAGEYEVRVNGAISSASGVPMRPDSISSAFSSKFKVSGSSDSTSPTIYPMLPNNSTSVSTNKIFEFGFNEQLAFSTVNNTNISLSRGATSESISTKYDSGKNSVFVVSDTALSPNTAYTVTFNGGVTDLAGNGVATTSYSYTTGAANTTTPALKEVRCDDYSCRIIFTKSMNHEGQDNATKWTSSILNTSNLVLERTAPSSAVISLSGKVLSYDAVGTALVVQGLSLTPSDSFRVTVSSSVKDISENLINTSNSNNIFNGKVEDSKTTFGQFGDVGMFGPPTAGFTGGTIGGGEFKPQGFGSFTADQFALGQADMAFAFNPLASADSNVFQVKFTPGVQMASGDQVVLTFPDGTDVSSAALDQQSPFYTDFNQYMAGTVTGSAITADTASNKVTITLGISGTPTVNDPVTIDLKKIVNPAVPKGPQTGGYTLGIKLVRSGAVLANKTSMPYFISAGGTNTLVVDVVAGANTSTPTSGANGTVYVHGGGPSGPMDKKITLTNGDVSQVEGSNGSSITYSNLANGCYFVGTDPFVTLGSSDYFGQMAPESVCLNGGETKTKWMLLTSASGGSTATLTVKMVDSNGDPYNFGGKDIDIFAGGPNKFVVKTLSSVSVAETNGYQLKLNANGHWFVGMGPAASKSTSGAKPASLGVMPPPSVDILVSNIASTPVLTSAVTTLPPSVSYSNGVVTFTFATANKAITGTVKDGSGTGLANVEVFAHAQGFGSPVFTQTNASGTFSLSVSDYGNYEIGAISDGMPPTTKNIELKNESGLKIYMEGKDVTSILNLTLNKASYTISGKVLNGNSDGVAYAPVFAVDASGNSVFGQTSIDGSYTLFVNNGTWNVRAELPPDKTDSCGAFIKTVTVSSASQANQNITSSNTSCSTLTGSVSVNSSALANVPLFIEEWDNTNNRPLAGGARKNSATDSSGNYSVNLGDGTYRLGTWDPIYGELSVTTTVSGSGTKDITVGELQTISFSFTGGTSAMNAFVELKNSTDSNKRLTKQINGLNTATTFSVPSGSTYNYFVNVFGIGNYNGSVVANSTTTINLGASNDFITVTGTVYVDSSTSTGKAGALVSFTNATTTVSAVTDDNGEYSIKIKAGSYSVSDSLSGYVPVQATSISFSTNTAAYDFGGSSPDQTSLKTAGYTIEGTVNSSLSVAMTSGYVWGINASSTVVTAQVNGDGTYSLPVTNGTWTIKAVGPRHVETSLAPVTVSGGNQTGKNITLTAADAGTNIPTSTTGMVAASTGGSINDSSASGIKLTAGAGVLDTGSGNVTLNFEKTFTAPDTANYSALGNATFNITATGDSTIKSLSGNAEIQLDYSAILASLPTSTSESDLKLVYYSPERGDYVPVEGGFTVDTSTNKITGFVDHFTDFMIAYSPSTEGVPTAPTGLTATVASASQINLSWTAVSGATSYTVYRSTDNVSYSSIATPTEVTYNNTSGLSASTLYYYKVTATNAQGEGASSSAASATTIAAAASAGGGGGSATVPTVITTTTVATSTLTTTTTVPVATTTIKSTTTTEVAKIEIVAPVVKVLVVTKPNSKVVMTLPSAVSYQPGTALKFTYKYKNESKKKVTVKIVRQMLDAKGKVMANVSANKTLKSSATFTGNISQNLAKNLKPGEYSIRVKIVGAKNKVLEENSFKFEVEKLKKKYFVLNKDVSSDSLITFDAKSLAKIKSNLVLPTNLQAKYNYLNDTELNQKIKMVRQLVSKEGKILETKTGKWTVKSGKSENQTFVQKLTEKLTAGVYMIRIQAYNQDGNSLLAENNLEFTVEFK